MTVADKKFLTVMARVIKDSFNHMAQQLNKRLQTEAPSRRELSPKVTEGERVRI